MYVLIFIGGVIVGIISYMLYSKRKNIYGVIEVDHKTEQCRFRISSAELSEYRTKRAIFEVKHDAEISQEEQGL